MLKKIALLLFALLGIATFAFTLAIAQEDDSADKSALVRYVEDTLSTPDRRISLGGIEGTLSSDVRLKSISIADRDGVWLRIDGVHLVWSRLALLKGALDIDTLEADRIEISRQPLPAEGIDPVASQGFSLPELPVSVQVGRIAATDVLLGAALLGEQARLSVEGGGSLADGSLDAHLDIHRKDDKPGQIALKAAYVAGDRELKLDLSVSEPKGGVIARLLDLPGQPSVDLTVQGAGPLDKFAADLRLATDGSERLSGRTTIARQSDAYGFDTSLSGDLSALVAPDYALYLRGGTALDVKGKVSDAGPISLETLALRAPVLTLNGSAELSADGFPTAIAVNGRLAASEGALPLGGANAATTIGEGTLAFRLTPDAGWTLALETRDLETADLTANNLTLTGQGKTTDLSDPAKRQIDFTLTGLSRGLVLKDAALARAAGGELRFAGSGTWQAGQPLTVSKLELATPTAEIAFTGKVEAGEIKGVTDVSAPSLAPFSDLAARELKGAAAIKADLALTPLTGAFDTTVDGFLTDVATSIAPLDHLLAGSTLVSGRLSRSTDGLRLDNLRISSPAFDLSVDGRQSRRDADLNATMTIDTLARLTPDASGPLAATLSLKQVDDGPHAITGRLSSARMLLKGQPFEALAVDLAGQIAGGAFDGTVKGSGRLKGKPATLSAHLASAADGSRRLDGLDLTIADAKIKGALSLDAAGLADGRLTVDAPQLAALAPLLLLDATGRLKADVVLSHDGGRQTARVKANGSALAMADLRVAAAEMSASVADLFGKPAVDGSLSARGLVTPAASVASIAATAKPAGGATGFEVTASGIAPTALKDAGLSDLGLTASGRFTGETVDLASARLTGPSGLTATASGLIPLRGNGLKVSATGTLPLALGNRLLAARGARLDGMAMLSVGVSGSLALPKISGELSLSGGSLSDPTTTMRLEAIAARLALDGDRVQISSASANIRGGGRLTVEGSLGLADGQPIDLHFVATRARLTDGKLATTKLDADLTLSGELKGGLALKGTVDVAKAEITVPEASAGADAMLEVSHDKTPRPVAETLARIAKARAASGGGGGTTLPISLELTINAPRELFVRGRGIDAEFGGRLTLQGTLDNPQPVGSFKLIRGRIQVIGQRITLNRAEVSLTGDMTPYVQLSATTKSDRISVTATIEGPANDPTIVLSSSPELPQDEILAHFLFKRSLSELSPLQIAQLAAAVAQLAGGSSNGLLDKLRAQVGFDDLDVTTDAKGNAAVTAGRYVTDRVYLGVTAGAGGQRGVSVNLDITDDLKAKAQATQESTGVGLFYEHEY